MRQIAPVSPALHLGADRVVVVGTARIRTDSPERTRGDLYPSLAQIAGHVMNSIFLDSLAVDLERLERINRTISACDPETLQQAWASRCTTSTCSCSHLRSPWTRSRVKHVRSLPWTHPLPAALAWARCAGAARPRELPALRARLLQRADRAGLQRHHQAPRGSRGVPRRGPFVGARRLRADREVHAPAAEASPEGKTAA